MPKNIVICSDGTGNIGGKTHGTNVWRIFNAVDRARNDGADEQITYYDDGIGTASIRWLRLLQGAFGWGISRNIREAYMFLVMNYKHGDRVFLFGFSRGAFTVRSLAGMIGRCGLIQRDKLIQAGSHQKQECMLRRVLHAYRSTRKIECAKQGIRTEREKHIRKALGLCDLAPRSIPIHFIGVWDTVDAVGVPIDEVKPILDRLSRWIRRRRLWGFHDLTPHPCIKHAYQALALDDERKSFHPLVWEVENNFGVGGDCQGRCVTHKHSRPFVQQVWFAGAHAYVGGGYPKDALSLVPLNWMMEKAEACGLRFLKGKMREYEETADVHGHMYDSRTGVRVFYRPAMRNLYCQPMTSMLDVSWGKALKYIFAYLFGPSRVKKTSRKPTRLWMHVSIGRGGSHNDWHDG